jgi:hypothetical protein
MSEVFSIHVRDGAPVDQRDRYERVAHPFRPEDGASGLGEPRPGDGRSNAGRGHIHVEAHAQGRGEWGRHTRDQT